MDVARLVTQRRYVDLIYKKTVKTVEDSHTSTQEQYNLYNFEDATLPNPTENSYKVILTIDGKSVQMDNDTGAYLSLISKQTYLELWPSATLQQTSIQYTQATSKGSGCNECYSCLL